MRDSSIAKVKARPSIFWDGRHGSQGGVRMAQQRCAERQPRTPGGDLAKTSFHFAADICLLRLYKVRGRPKDLLHAAL